MLEYVIGPDENSDLLQLLDEPQLGPVLAYVQQPLADSANACVRADHPNGVGLNYYDHMRDGGFFALRPLLIEAGLVKADWSPDGVAGAAGIIAAILRVRAAGGNVDTICLDEPLVAARTLGLSIEQCASIVIERLTAITAATGHARFVLVQEYPDERAERILAFVRLLRAANVGLVGIHLDVDHRVFRRYSFWRAFTEHRKDVADCQRLAAEIRSLGLTLGVILTPDGDRTVSDETFVATAFSWLKQLYEYFGWPDRILAQSWQGRNQPPVHMLTSLLLQAAAWISEHPHG